MEFVLAIGLGAGHESSIWQSGGGEDSLWLGVLGRRGCAELCACVCVVGFCSVKGNQVNQI